MASEFDFIQNLKKNHRLDFVGDDCAVLPKNPEADMLITVDMLVEDIDFRLDWTTPELFGHKALAVSLSDIAAMGGRPEWAMASLGVPEKLWFAGFADRFYDGWFELAKTHGVQLIGGDISRTPEFVVVDSIVGGEADRGKAVLRSGAKPGDLMFVSGSLGGSAAGLKLLSSGGGRLTNGSDTWQQSLLLRHLRPEPETAAGIFLGASQVVTSMIDLSDGLSSDLWHICQMSNAGARIFADELPIDENLFQMGISETEIMDFVLHGGEDFRLLFTLPPANISHIAGKNFTQIG